MPSDSPSRFSVPETVAEQVVETLAFNADGLVPAIAQQYDTGEVLMMAWMNAAAVRKTLADGVVHYYSRSRQALWFKGETSGHVQTLHDFRYDCDSDTILLMIDQTGVACHTGRRSCFFNRVTAAGVTMEEKSPMPMAADRA